MGVRPYLYQGKDESYWCISINHDGQHGDMRHFKNLRMDEQFVKAIADAVRKDIKDKGRAFPWDYWLPHLKGIYKFKDVMDKYWSAKQRTPNTEITFKYCKKHILAAVGDKDIRELRNKDFDWIAAIPTKIRYNVRTFCQAIMNYALHKEYLDRPVFIDTLKREPTHIDYLGYDEQLKILECVDERFKGPCLISLEMGLRVQEIVPLLWADVDWKHDGLRVRRVLSGRVVQERTKEGNEKWLPMTQPVKEMLERMNTPKHEPGECVFANRNSKHFHINQITQAWKDACRKAGFPNYRLHKNRHSLAIRLLQEGRSMKEVSMLLGHKSVLTTEQVYARLDGRALRALRTLDNGKNKVVNLKQYQ